MFSSACDTSIPELPADLGYPLPEFLLGAVVQAFLPEYLPRKSRNRKSTFVLWSKTDYLIRQAPEVECQHFWHFHPLISPNYTTFSIFCKLTPKALCLAVLP